jgi:hypothetical protein
VKDALLKYVDRVRALHDNCKPTFCRSLAMFGRVNFVLLVATAVSVAGCQNPVQDSPAPPKTSRLSDEQQAAVKDALKALGRIEGAVKTGVIYVRYGELVGDARAAVDEAVRVLPSDYWELATTFKSVVAEYKDALEAWGEKIRWGELEAEVRLQAAWSRAGKSLENARLLAEGKPAVKDPPKTVNKPAESPKVEKPKTPELVPSDPKPKKDPPPPPPPPPQPTADQLADAKSRAANAEPAVQVGADRIVPSVVRKAADDLTTLRRARWVSEKYPHSTKAANDKWDAEKAWDKTSAELGKAKAAALAAALAEAEAEADRKYPLLKTGPAEDQIRSRLLREKMYENYLAQLKQAAQAKVDAEYRLPVRTGELPK